MTMTRVPPTISARGRLSKFYLWKVNEVKHEDEGRGKRLGVRKMWYTESAEERNAAALAFLDSVLGGTRATTSTCPFELRQALVEVRRTLRGPEAAEASTTGRSLDRYSSHYTRCRRRDRILDLVSYDLFLMDFMALSLFWTLYGHGLWTTFRGGMTFVLL
ncbi:hypothetical protein RHGRI_013636 [Rhododendron griersonianum]|uniref:Uncharacterized protein n=1 Tax=Rhododendron griersonianum TaxID=479676 RepID=A0AAV6K6I5_9ERIC|nr:hypothetical protein RHGRI_013636 [Rhododendron griersonianum]